MYEGVDRQTLLTELRDLVELVKIMRRFQKVDRHRESITASAARAKAEDDVDVFLELSQLSGYKRPSDDQAADGLKLEDSV